MGKSKKRSDVQKNAVESPSSTAATSLVDEVLKSNAEKPILTAPEDPVCVYPASAFPPLSTFDISVTYPALVIPVRRIPELRTKLSHISLQRAKLKMIYALDENDPVPGREERNRFRKMVLIDRPKLFEQDAALRELLQQQPDELCRASHMVTVSYPDWTVEQVLRRILPLKEIPSAFEIIGHLAHINLRDEALPFKYIIGKALLDKNGPRIRTVVNKVGTIASEYRTFGMEVIAGNEEADWSHVTVKEEGCQYELDFTKVYWNSRLGGEHRRLVDLIQLEAADATSPVVVADLMAGIGPFAVPLTSQKGGNVHVHANDLNPSSYEYLLINSKKNGCQNLECYKMDGRAFCHQLQNQGIDFQHVLMNLPATATEFLDAFRGFKGKTLPRIHVHCFSSKDPKEADRDTIKRCAAALGCPISADVSNVVVHTVRNIAPNKNMYCVSFTLPSAARALPQIKLLKQKEDDSKEPESKRTKLS